MLGQQYHESSGLVHPFDQIATPESISVVATSDGTDLPQQAKPNSNWRGVRQQFRSSRSLNVRWNAEDIPPEIMYLKDILCIKDAPEDRSLAEVLRILNLALGGRRDQGRLRKQPSGSRRDKGRQRSSAIYDSILSDSSYVKGWSLIREVPDQLQVALARQIHIQLARKEATILTEGQKIQRSYFIVHGEVAMKQTFGSISADSRIEQPFQWQSLREGNAFGDLPRDPRANSKIALGARAVCDTILFYIDHSKYWLLMQRQMEADAQSRKIELLQTLYPSWGDAGDEAAQQKWQNEIKKMASKLKLRHFQAGETVAQQGNQVKEIYFVVSGELTVHIDLKLVEYYVGAVKKKDGALGSIKNKSEVVDGSSGSAAEQGMSTRMELSQTMTPRQLGIVKSIQIRLATACRGDSIGDSHIWKGHQFFKYSAVALTSAELACIPIYAFNEIPPRFLALRYKCSELNYSEYSEILSRLLRIEVPKVSLCNKPGS
jgi:CRP-like cAMP-binding protein